MMVLFIFNRLKNEIIKDFSLIFHLGSLKELKGQGAEHVIFASCISYLTDCQL